MNAGSLTITPKQININANATNKTYDGSTSVATMLSSFGIVEGDALTFTGTGNAVDKNSGLGKTVTVTSITGSGTDLANYSFADTTQTTVDIAKKSITVSGQGVNRAYNGTNIVDVILGSTDVLNGDQVTFTGVGNTVDKNVGVAKSVSVTGISSLGSDGGNYDFATDTQTTVDISKRAAAVAALGVNRAYDGTTVVGVTLSSVDIIAGDDLTLEGTGALQDKNAGLEKAVSVSGISGFGADLANYDIATTAQTTVDISKRAVAANAVATDRTYDGSTSVAVEVNPLNTLVGDELTLSGTGTMANAGAGANKAVNVALTATGSDADNYDFSAPLGTTANIARKLVEIELKAPVVKRANGNTSVTLKGNNFAITGLIEGEKLQVRDVTGQFADGGAGINKYVSVMLGGQDLIGDQGTLAANYDLLNATVSGNFGEILSATAPSYEAALTSIPTNITNIPGTSLFSFAVGPRGPAVSTGDADNGVATQSTSTIDGGIASVQTKENLFFRRTFSIADGGIKLPSGVTEDDSAQ